MTEPSSADRKTQAAIARRLAQVGFALPAPCWNGVWPAANQAAAAKPIPHSYMAPTTNGPARSTAKPSPAA